ncbi:Cholinesterase (Acylcholine acylhydrolase) (Butyrylcholine esterase) (Choline esterase II) (Pseudocholinesterase) [Durusdinium trenchii]|uniref:Cholinesterase (Acylcholine acylhydrolase) (Butyrylcholine esterase) (Choline esterase II) (Pseudocholinesterase) n=1 Tax=Durusdinium trenchii TaxID=1381693 RepID=A0ABP0QVE3_9DINO
MSCLPCCFGGRAAWAAGCRADAPRAQLSSGSILGEYAGSSEHFAGVPFAQPPVGQLRWKKPAPVEPWLGDLDCTSNRAERLGRPVQAVAPHEDRQPAEDCLHLDLWLPPGTLASPMKKQLPVLVWIYGGGLLSGSKDDPGSSGQGYAEQGVIFVCINYRVGALGFLCPRNGDANCGLWDQVSALEWIQREIGNLGGDPAQVTIMGQSAGGDSVYWSARRACLMTRACGL